MTDTAVRAERSGESELDSRLVVGVQRVLFRGRDGGRERGACQEMTQNAFCVVHAPHFPQGAAERFLLDLVSKPGDVDRMRLSTRDQQ